MTPHLPSPAEQELRQLIESFIQERLQGKLDKLKPDEDDKRQALLAGHRREAWLADAARRVGQLQLVTHTLKPIHPDARGSNLHSLPQAPGQPGLAGSHELGDKLVSDVVGNAAALDVFKFLSLEYQGKNLLNWLTESSAETLQALSDNAEQAREWRQAFIGITAVKGAPASHSLAKQLYFPLPGSGYHLLAPLFPTSLVHHVHGLLREARFGEAAKAAREASKHKQPWPHGFSEYPNLAIQKFGGTKPQNISQLNSERYGENWLLASLPPHWERQEVRAPLQQVSVFEHDFGRSPEVARLTRTLRRFLATTTHNNLAIRQHRAQLVGQICDEALHYADRLRELEPGWSASPDCRLHEAEQIWLDPLRVHTDEAFMRRRLWADWPMEVSERFANWLNRTITSKGLVMGEAEAGHWRQDLGKELKMFKEILEDERD
ncbi:MULTISPECIES: type I-F CRISPR-associated protein Csy1 [Pseudomonas aeruginosa group]|uniref:type I-F CRISPR-associated protein Csy1 n=1 Tax=Pseudomonas aeruginosa group TaxID=136841 RepID=UPI000D1508BE|nr:MULTISPECIES: type I-F CRISPR-associated protein Csy1 [Pseudomonas aeruginosa group]AVR67832.1 type I-F CRISPR-associated protein Csy1 [Pseudomonas paraeruginosa]MBG3906035.1 type I-F CRISPR-associated protein Csy1 [Pseudomonas aeruginosa]MBG4205116.1 type I-F CRISPR-associated protein Csy1 [Pseudomonas aeruginosa]MBG4278920.1 type I-F CRISPR-associated protein Csy1 [Pseudomonas aeruginosa]MBG6891337.1 type I-F CRISPR-associated protein Csy1 [Pseudomonas aeruginosa]